MKKFPYSALDTLKYKKKVDLKRYHVKRSIKYKENLWSHQVLLMGSHWPVLQR